MRFVTDPRGWERYGRLWGVPILIRGVDREGPEIAGTNVVAEWLLGWWPELAQRMVNAGRWLIGREPLPGWPILIYEPEDDDTQE